MTNSREISNRPTIKKYLLPYLLEIGKELGTNDVSEIVAQIINEHKRFVRGRNGVIQIPSPDLVRAISEPSRSGIGDDAIANLSSLLDAA